jgi:DNA-binding GntR family transcriptional regulator
MPSGASLPTVSHSAVNAYAAIQQGILTGRLRPGDRLRERDIAAELGISRTPVREALRQLEADGFVQHRPNAGATVSDMSETSILQLAELRANLAAFAARLAARRGGAPLAEALRPQATAIAAALMHGGEPGFDPKAAFDLIAGFHATMLDGCGNIWLARAFHRTTFPVVMQVTYLRADPATWAAIARYFADLVAALEGGEEDLAASLADAYFRQAGQKLLAAYRARTERPGREVERRHASAGDRAGHGVGRGAYPRP